MLVCSYVPPEEYIAGPREIGRVLRPANDETFIRPAPGGLDKQCFESRLTIGVPQAAASNRRPEGHQPSAAIACRVTLSVDRAEA